ncbi:MAG: NeuD/PglB/VioB family sugar acetyltransferase [Anaerolineales bacterium]|nr:NeuD/PglB/VioB family sugar acetyltransferase [Anaerolineales bacterium]
MTKSPPYAITIPLVNPNEPEAILAGVYVEEGQAVKPGDPICTLETTKATFEITAEVSGYVAGLRAGRGELVQAGEVLCYLAEDPQWKPDLPGAGPTGVEATLPPGLRITQPALVLARSLGVELSQLPAGPLITENALRLILERSGKAQAEAPEASIDPSAVLIYGGGGHGKSLIDLIQALGGYRLVGVVDDALPMGGEILGAPVLGGANTLHSLHQQGVRQAVNAVGGIGNIASRIRVFDLLAEAGFSFPALVHPTALVEPSAQLSPGVQVFPHAYVGSAARLGFGAIVNTGAIVSHDCVLGDYANVSPGAMLAGEVYVGASVLIGMGATVNLQVTIGEGAKVGNSATVKSDVPARRIVRAGSIFPE